MNKTALISIILLLPVILSAQAQRWIYCYSGPYQESEAYDIDYGRDGNIYLAGQGKASIYWDFKIVSLTANGGQRWIYSYNGSGNNRDIARALVCGPDSNVYAAGISTPANMGGRWDYTVISVNPAGGERWVYNYNGPDNDYDGAWCIAYGSDGNIYTAGFSYDSVTMNDLAVISLSDSGSLRWMYLYDGPGSGYDEAKTILYGTDGNIYVGGYTGPNEDMTVVSLSDSGSLRWVYRRPTASQDDDVRSMSFGPDSNLYVCGIENNRFTVFSLSDSGSLRWEYQDSLWGGARSITYGLDGNLYITGNISFPGNAEDLVVISLDTAGSERWFYRYSGTAGLGDGGNEIIYGADSNLYVAGHSAGVDSIASDVFIVCLSDSGAQRWTYRYNGPGNYIDLARSIVYGADSNLYAAGSSCPTPAYWEIMAVSLTTNGFAIEEEVSSSLPGNAFHLSAGTFQDREIAYQISAAEPLTIQLSLYNILGAKVDSWQNTTFPGIAGYTRRIPALSRGIYFLRAQTEKGYGESSKLIVW